LSIRQLDQPGWKVRNPGLETGVFYEMASLGVVVVAVIAAPVVIVAVKQLKQLRKSRKK